MPVRRSLSVVVVALALLVGGCSTAYQGDAGHTGAFPMGIRLPLERAWTASFAGQPSYAVTAKGSTFVTAKSPGGGGTFLYSLAITTGAVRWSTSLGGPYPWSGLAADVDSVYAVNASGQLQAFRASDGSVRWARQLTGQFMFTSPPTVRDGRLFVSGAGSGGTLYAVDTDDGSILWTAGVANGDHSSPSVSSDTVFVSYACNMTVAFDVATGAMRWHSNPPCTGGGGKTTVYDAQTDSLFVRDFVGGVLQLDATTGALRHTFPFESAPAIGSTSLYVVHGGVLTSQSLTTGTIDWNASGDGTLATTPIVIGGDYVLVGASSGMLYAFDVQSGAVRWSTNVGAPMPSPDEQNVSQPLTGLASGSGYVFVPTTTGTLVAYRTKGGNIFSEG